MQAMWPVPLSMDLTYSIYIGETPRRAGLAVHPRWDPSISSYNHLYYWNNQFDPIHMCTANRYVSFMVLLDRNYDFLTKDGLSGPVQCPMRPMRWALSTCWRSTMALDL